MNDDDLLRYSRHILLEGLGIEAQERFAAANVLVIGCGGLGCPVLMYLAAAGVGRITIVDSDRVEVTNLQRQVLFCTADVGRAKVEAARDAISRMNPGVAVTALELRADPGMLDGLVADCDLVLDCSDNFETRHAINRACVRHRRPLVSGAAVRFDGQVSVFELGSPDGACYHCLFPETAESDTIDCATFGVFAPLTGIIGSTQAAEALKVIAKTGESLAGRLLILDAMRMQWQSIALTRDPACPVCGRA